jgi:hypothetical protein
MRGRVLGPVTLLGLAATGSHGDFKKLSDERITAVLIGHYKATLGKVALEVDPTVVGWGSCVTTSEFFPFLAFPFFALSLNYLISNQFSDQSLAFPPSIAEHLTALGCVPLRESLNTFIEPASETSTWSLQSLLLSSNF